MFEHPHHRFLKLPKAMEDLYTNKILRDLAISMVSIFIPIYLLQTGFGLFEVLTFLIVWTFLNSVFFPLVAGLNSVIQVRTSMIVSSILSVVSLFMLVELPAAPWLLYPTAIVTSLYKSMYWQTFHCDFARSTDKNSGKQIGLLFAIRKVVAVIGPVTGAFVITFFGYDMLLLVAALLFILSAMPLVGLERRKEPISLNIKILKGFRPFAKVFFVESFVFTANMLIWPIFVFLFLKDLMTVGYVFSLGYLVMAIVSIKIGNSVKEGNYQKMIKLGGLFVAFAWFIRFLVDNIYMIYTSQLIFGAFMLLVSIPIQRKMYQHAKKTNISDFFVLREGIITISRIIMFGLLFFVSFEIFFLIMGLLSLSLVFINFNPKKPSA